MNIFKTFTLKWWQGALFKWGIFTLGIAAGAYWNEIFDSAFALTILLLISVPCLTYVTYVWWKQ